ncbi:hypothetical protein IscW_ISCW003871 [Ixodes scapularis]|uniref:Uncharacterized protein n=1 Tax=Ixodes scapularis TaxID=6945 RepID=B7PJG7_IXOSC|nr:hypothetical protein IscW_ISCW003871 [Ixodes scapularis]|eukprot:XP_002408029.1 hypothetical protein IscW_ISCW003871 [Ixodes scapularis]
MRCAKTCPWLGHKDANSLAETTLEEAGNGSKIKHHCVLEERLVHKVLTDEGCNKRRRMKITTKKGSNPTSGKDVYVCPKQP